MSHVCKWEPAEALGQPAKMCFGCRFWTQITKAEFKSLFGKSFWKFKKAHDDNHTFGGYKGRAGVR